MWIQNTLQWGCNKPTFSSLAGNDAAEMNSLFSEKIYSIYFIDQENGFVKHQPFIDDAAVLSAGKSNTQRSFESINWSGVTSFHWINEMFNFKIQFKKIISQTFTNWSNWISPSGATKLCTMNLCLFFSFGSKLNGCKQTMEHINQFITKVIDNW